MSSGRLPLRISFLTLKNGRFITTYCNYLLSLIFAKIVCFYLSAPRPGSIWHIICFEEMNESKYKTFIPLRYILG